MPLVIGFDSVEEVLVEGLDLPPSAAFVAHFRHKRDGALVAELSTANGGIVFIPPNLIIFNFSAAVSRTIGTAQLIFDCARTDGDAPLLLGFEGTAQFHKPVTQLP